MKHEHLHVVTMVSNPVRFKTRYRLYNEFKERMLKNDQVKLYTAEVQQGERTFQICHASDLPHELQLRTSHEIWHKESAINLMFQRLPQNWKYAAWIDADLSFANENWAEETLHALQTYAVVQPWSECIDLGPENQALAIHHSFCKILNTTGIKSLKWHPNYPFGHSGFAWAIRREAFNDLGGLYDKGILGSGDFHMAAAFIGRALESIHGGATAGYKYSLDLWQQRAEKYIKRNLGHVPGTIYHHWHGRKKTRYYQERWKILVDNKYDPILDTKSDWQGLLQLTDRSIKLRDDIRQYFRSRMEDSTDME